jgi:ribonuclease R
MASTQKQKKPAKIRPAGFPTRDQVMEFITSSDQPAGKREIAKAFGLKGQEKIALKALLKDMADEGLLDFGPARAFHKMGGVPKVTVLRIVDVDDTTLIATPERWEAEGQPAPRLRILERGKRGALTIGDRILARTPRRARNCWAWSRRGRAASSGFVPSINASARTRRSATQALPIPATSYWPSRSAARRASARA